LWEFERQREGGGVTERGGVGPPGHGVSWQSSPRVSRCILGVIGTICTGRLPGRRPSRCRDSVAC
jgi:hypothetical protein